MASPKFRRRSAERPAEIVAAALAVFAERGFAAARLDEIAARAGVSKGALYLYYETKEDIFHAVVTQAVAPGLAPVRQAIETFDGPFGGFLQTFAEAAASIVAGGPVGPIAKMIIGESRNFPDLARFWHDEVAGPMLAAMAGAIVRAQARGEVRAGEPRLYALQLAAPLLMGALWRETFTPVGAPPLDVERLVRQHFDTLAHGLLA
jgi:AcrR family transcriptional regulator